MVQDEVSNMKYSEPIVEAVPCLSYFACRACSSTDSATLNTALVLSGLTYIWMGSQVLKRLGGSR